MDLVASKPALVDGQQDDSPQPHLHLADRRLAERAADGELEAQRELVSRLLPRIRGTVGALLGAHVDREDAVQACALELLSAIKTFRGQSSLETWARQVVSRRCIKFAQKHRRDRDVIDPDVDPNLSASSDSLSILRERLPRPLDHYLDKLSDLHRAALVLRHAFGYSLREIAELTETDPNTVKARLYHGGKRLRSLIDADLAAPPLPFRGRDHG